MQNFIEIYRQTALEQAINFNDTLYGSAGNDVINTGGGQNFVNNWQGGNDTIDGGSGADYMYLGYGNNIAISNGSSASTDGTADVFAASNGNNQLYANGQVDVATAIAQQNALAPSNQKGDFFSVVFADGRGEVANDFDWRVTA